MQPLEALPKFSPLRSLLTARPRAFGALMVLLLSTWPLAQPSERGQHAQRAVEQHGSFAANPGAAPEEGAEEGAEAEISEPRENAQPAVPVLERVAFLGASASAGYALAVDLGTAFVQQLRVTPGQRANFADNMFFARPDPTAEAQIEQALEFRPSLVVAVDYLFWMAYGFQEEDQRARRLERGFTLLEQLECPLVVATLPDMRQSVGRMLAPGQVPKPETLRAMNRRIREWAQGRGALVIDLERIVYRFLRGESIQVAGQTWPREPGAPLLLRDRLHPNGAGQAAVVTFVASALLEAEMLPTEAVELDVAATHEKIVSLEQASLNQRRREREERRRQRVPR